MGPVLSRSKKDNSGTGTSIRVIAIKNAQKSIEDGTMGSPYLSSNESIILSTNNVVINTVLAEAILTNERLMIVDARHPELQPQDIPFHAIETVTTGEDANQDPMLSLSLITGPGVTQALDIVFPQPPKMKRVAERDEWAARFKELSIISARESGTRPMEILPPWVPGPLPDEKGMGSAPASGAGAVSGFRNPPLMPRKPQKPAASMNRMAITAVVIVIALIALAAGAYLFAPSLFGKGETSLPPVTAAPAVTAMPTTAATPAVTIAATAVPVTTPEIIIPPHGVWVLVKDEGPYSGSAGAPERFRTINAAGNHAYQLSVKDELVMATIQKRSKTGEKLTVEIYNEGKLIKSGSVSSPEGTVSISVDLRTV
jgi:hypothetical protein